jgi:hypothetical protein
VTIQIGGKPSTKITINKSHRTTKRPTRDRKKTHKKDGNNPPRVGVEGRKKRNKEGEREALVWSTLLLRLMLVTCIALFNHDHNFAL